MATIIRMNTTIFPMPDWEIQTLFATIIINILQLFVSLILSKLGKTVSGSREAKRANPEPKAKAVFSHFFIGIRAAWTVCLPHTHTHTHTLSISHFPSPVPQQNEHLYSCLWILLYCDNSKNKHFLKILVECRSPSGEEQQSADTRKNAILQWLGSLLCNLGAYLNHSCLWRMADLLEVI